MKFELDEDQVKKLQVWQEAIKLIHGEYGRYEYLFSPNGIGTTITVYSYLANAELDLSDVEKW
jgi:hypothetical protein